MAEKYILLEYFGFLPPPDFRLYSLPPIRGEVGIKGSTKVQNSSEISQG